MSPIEGQKQLPTEVLLRIAVVSLVLGEQPTTCPRLRGRSDAAGSGGLVGPREKTDHDSSSEGQRGKMYVMCSN